ncbi:MAG: ATP-binding protein [Planctomycetota bacterium]
MLLPRHLAPRLERALRSSPVVLLTGARQVGKSTLARDLASSRWAATYLTLDDRPTLDAALIDPDGFLEAQPVPLVIDEVQRAPDLLRAVKRRVDLDRRPGRYLLTGSANVLTLKSVSERLAGRVSVFQLEPFSWREATRAAPGRALEVLWRARKASDAVRALGDIGRAHRWRELQDLMLRGGYPIPARLRSAIARRDWYGGYRATYLERDIRDLSSIAHLPEFGRLLSILALRTGQLVNFADLSRDTGLPAVTLHRYFGLMETTYQIVLLQPYFVNAAKRLVKTPKLYATDTGLSCYLAGTDTWEAIERQGRSGPLLETWVHSELRRALACEDDRTGLYFWRSHDGYEVDFVLEGPGGRLLGIEAKRSSTIDRRDRSGLDMLRKLVGDRLGLGVIAYGGAEIVGLDSNTLAVPFGRFFGPDA